MHMKAAPRATWAPGRGSFQGEEWSSCSTDAPSSSCQAGWNSTSSTRLPTRSWVLSFGGFSLARAPSSIIRALPATAPTAEIFSSAQSAPSRLTASPRAVSALKTL